MINPIWDHDYYKDCIPNFGDNLSKPRHRWYEFKEGYSDAFVQRAIQHYKLSTGLHNGIILDPFSGSGTTALTGVQHGFKSIAIEVNPFMAFIGKTKSKPASSEFNIFENDLDKILKSTPLETKSPLEGFSTFSKSKNNEKWLFNKSVLRGFEAIKKSIDHSSHQDNIDFFKLALYSAIMDCCNARRDGKCLRYKKDWKTLGYSSIELRSSFKDNSEKILDDIRLDPLSESKSCIMTGDVRSTIKFLETGSIDLITFSPPYLNSFDYSDVYRPELFLGGYVSNNGELRELRSQTLRSHVQYAWDNEPLYPSPWVNEVTERIRARKNYLWNKNIPGMINNYFTDMDIVFKETYRVAKKNAIMWFIVSTSAYAGVEIPVDLILADLAVKNGWELESVNALRNLRTSSQCSDSNIRKVRLRESMIACRKS